MCRPEKLHPLKVSSKCFWRSSGNCHMNTWIVFSGFSALLLCFIAAHSSRTSPCHCCLCLLDLRWCCLPLLSWQQNRFIQMRGKSLSFPHCVAICEVGTGVAVFSWRTIHQSFSHTSFFFPSQKPMWLEKTIFKGTLWFLFLFLRTFMTLSFRQEQSHSAPKPAKILQILEAQLISSWNISDHF